MIDVKCRLKSGEMIRIWVKRKVEGRESMFVVYEVVAQGQDGNQGIEYKRLKSFKDLEEANDFMKQQEMDKPNGWYSYTIMME